MTSLYHIIIFKLFCHTINTVVSEYLMPDPFRIACFSDIVTHFNFLYVLFLCEPFSCHFIKEISLLEFRFYNTSNFHTATLSFNWTKYCYFLKILCFPKIRWPSCDNGRPLVFMGSDSLSGGGELSSRGRASSSQSFWSSDTSCTSGTSYADDVSAVSSLIFKSLVLSLITSREFAVSPEGLCLASEFF